MKRRARAPTYVLRLYVNGASPRSARALRRLKELCEEFVPGRYQLQVVDIYQRPRQAHADDVIATPTLIRLKPRPVRRFVGDFTDGQVLFGRAAR